MTEPKPPAQPVALLRKLHKAFCDMAEVRRISLYTWEHDKILAAHEVHKEVEVFLAAHPPEPAPSAQPAGDVVERIIAAYHAEVDSWVRVPQELHGAMKRTGARAIRAAISGTRETDNA